MTWPLVRDLPHSLSDPGDPFLNTWILHWDWYKIFRDPLNLFQANIFHPAKYALAFSENLLGVALFGFPLFFAGFSPVTVYNVLFLLGMMISAWGAWALATELTGDALASVIAGLFFAWVPFRYDHRPHIQFQWGGFIPLALLFLIRYFRTRSNRDLSFFGLFFVWNIYSCVYYGIYGTLAVMAILLVEAVRLRLWRDWRVIRSLALTFLICGAVIFPILHPYSIASKLYGFHRSIEEVGELSATLKSYLSTGIDNRMYGRLTARFAAGERQLFYGLTIPILAVVGLILLGRRGVSARSEQQSGARTPPWIRVLDVLIIVGGALRLNYTFTGGYHFGRLVSVHDPFRLSLLLAILLTARLCIRFPTFSRYRNLADFVRRSAWRGPATIAIVVTLLGWMLAAGPQFFLYRALFQGAPFVMAGLRVPARAVSLTHVGLGILAALGLSLWRKGLRRSAQIGLPVFIFAIVLFEFRTAPNPYYKPDTKPLATSIWLSNHAFAGGVLELPWDFVDNIEYVYRTTEHDKPILNGYSGFFPHSAGLLESRLQVIPIPARTFDILEKLDCRLIVFHSDRSTLADRKIIGTFLANGARDGRITPIAEVHEPRDDAYIFATAWRTDPISPMPTPPELEATRASTMAFLDRPMPR